MNVYIDFILTNDLEKIHKKNIKAKRKQQELTFCYDNENIKLSINNNGIIMNKESEESIIIFNFIKNKKTECKYFIKELNFYIDTYVKTNEIVIGNNKILIDYELWIQDEYSGKFTYEIIIKEEK